MRNLDSDNQHDYLILVAPDMIHAYLIIKSKDRVYGNGNSFKWNITLNSIASFFSFALFCFVFFFGGGGVFGG